MEGVAPFERASTIGGTWRDNTYPNCQCDVPSHLYSFSFAPNPGWTRAFAPQQEIQEYLETLDAANGLDRVIRFDEEVLEARWNGDGLRWGITTTKGMYTADVLIAAHGALSAPSIPDLPGLDLFEGRVLHSAAWDHDVDLAGATVAVVGTGASAIQIVPGIQPVTPGGILTADGTERRFDVIVLATGFKVTDHPDARRIHGSGGRSLAEALAGGMRAYLGTTVSGLPNLFLLTGPNTGLATPRSSTCSSLVNNAGVGMAGAFLETGHGHPPEMVADAIARAARRNPAIVRVGLEASLGWWLHRFAPVAVQQLLARQRLC